MANIKSAKKRIKVTDKKTARNRRVKANVKSAIKDFENAMDSGDMELAKEKLVLVEKKFDQAVSKGTFHKNTASRKVSRLNKRFNKANA